MIRLTVLKLRKTDLNKNPEDFLKKFGAVSDEMKRAYPQHVFMASADYATLKRNFRRRVRKDSPHMSKKRLDYAVDMHFLQYGPNETLGLALQPGTVVVDLEGIQENIALDILADLNEAIAQPYRQSILSKVKGFFEKNFGAPPIPQE